MGVLVFWVYAGEVFWCEAVVDVMTKVLCCEVVRLKWFNVVYCLVYECFVVRYFHYV